MKDDLVVHSHGFADILLKRMNQCWKKKHFQSFLVVFVHVVLEVFLDLLVIMNFMFVHQSVPMDFVYPLSNFLDHSMICSQGI